MKAKEFRTEAREKLAGKWGKAALITFLYLLLFIILEMIEKGISESLKSLVSIVSYIIMIPLAFGLNISYFKIYNGEETETFGFIKDGFNNFKVSWAIMLRTALKMIIPLVVLFISGIIMGVLGVSSVLTGEESLGAAFILFYLIYMVVLVWMMTISYKYAMAAFIVIENPETTAKEALEKSWELMQGNRLKLVGLQFSFIGWAILSVFSLYIGLFWVMPYMAISTIAFYKHLKGEENTEAVQEIVEEKPEEVVQEIEEKTEEVSEKTEKEDVSEENE